MHQPALRSPRPQHTAFATYTSRLLGQQNSSRLFGTTTSLRRSELEAHQLPSIPQDGGAIPAGKSQQLREATPPIITAPAADSDALDRAKNDGVILDLSPESLDAILKSSSGHQDEGAPRAPRKSDKRDTRKRAEKRAAVEGESETKRKKSELSAQGRKAADAGKDKGKGKAEAKDKAEGAKGPTTRNPTYREHWQLQKEALKAKFPEGWQPRKRLSPDAIDGVKALHRQFPTTYTLPVLSKRFEVSPEVIRRILRSKWCPTPEEEEKRQKRWFERGKKIWTVKAALGVKPPRVWRKEGIVRDPKWNVKRGPRTEWPYVPHWQAQPEEPEGPKSAQEQLSENLV